jgi:hypothetical protein
VSRCASALESYWALPAEALCTALEATPAGLGAEQAVRRHEHDGPNALRRAPAASALRSFTRQLASPLVLILMLAAVVSGVVGNWLDAEIVVAIVSAARCSARFKNAARLRPSKSCATASASWPGRKRANALVASWPVACVADRRKRVGALRRARTVRLMLVNPEIKLLGDEREAGSEEVLQRARYETPCTRGTGGCAIAGSTSSGSDRSAGACLCRLLPAYVNVRIAAL